MIKIGDIHNSHIVPFDIENEKLKKLFSFYLHKAPTIKSHSKSDIPSCGLEKCWSDFIEQNNLKKVDFHVYSEGSKKDEHLKKYNLQDDSEVNRRSKRFICYKKSQESDMECLLRHLRNSIAHSCVYVYDKSNRLYILFEDYNSKDKLTTRILLNQTVLTELRKILK